MKDAKGRTLYIGKAKNLKNRVCTYFHESYGDPRIRTMVSKIEDIETLQAPSEVGRPPDGGPLIKDVQPATTTGSRTTSPSPCSRSRSSTTTRRSGSCARRRGERGDLRPLHERGELRDAVRVLQKIFKFATCTIEMRESDSKRRFFRPCLLHAIDRCSAPLRGPIPKERYLADIDLLRKFLAGGREEVVAQLEAR
jgi:excinuclease ABC subunit C